MEDLLKLYREQETFTPEQDELIEEAINNGELNTEELFLDWTNFMYKDGQEMTGGYDQDDVIDFGEHYQNMRTHKENEQLFIER